nr:hypothetical protein [Cohnella faecalis]
MRRRNWTAKQRETLFWLAWLLPVMGFFSIAGFFHQYYLIMLAPPIAALAGAGFSEMWQAYRDRTGWTSWLLPAAVLVTTTFQWYIMHPYDGTIGGGWSKGVALAGLIVSAALIAWRSMGKSGKLVRIFAVGGVLVLLIGPAYWATTPIAYGISSMTPIVGPGSSDDRGGGGMPGGFAMGRGQGQGQGPGSSSGIDEALWTYLKQNNTGERYLVAATDYGTAAPYMIDKGEQVVILNGFNSSDQVYTTASLEALVARGEVKYFLLSSGGMGGGRGGGNSELTQWIQEHGTAVSSSEWQTNGTADDGNSGGFGGRATLYEVSLQQGG